MVCPPRFENPSFGVLRAFRLRERYLRAFGSNLNPKRENRDDEPFQTYRHLMVWLISLRIIKNCQLLTRRQLEKAGGWEGWLILFRGALADRGGLIT